MTSTLDSQKLGRYVMLCLGLLSILTAIFLPTEWYDQIPKSRENLPAPPIKGVTFVLVYAWNEHDEGGWLTPTPGEGTSRLDAIEQTLRELSPPIIP